jgi:trk system potassium uptake protein TrkA
MKAILIIGMGTFGTQIARRMSELRCEVMAVDTNEERINEILPYVTNACIGDCTNEEFMRSLGIRNYDVCIVSIGDNFQNSLETTALLSELGAKRVISRASNDVQMKFLLRNGADEVVYPEMQMAMRIATKYASDNILDFIQLDNSYSIYEMKVPRDWDGKNLMQLDLRKKFKLNIIAFRHKGMVDVPMPDTVFSSDDVVFVVGSSKDIQKCFRV